MTLPMMKSSRKKVKTFPTRTSLSLMVEKVSLGGRASDKEFGLSCRGGIVRAKDKRKFSSSVVSGTEERLFIPNVKDPKV